MINGQRGQQLEQELSNWAATDQQRHPAHPQAKEQAKEQHKGLI